MCSETFYDFNDSRNMHTYVCTCCSHKHLCKHMRTPRGTDDKSNSK